MIVRKLKFIQENILDVLLFLLFLFLASDAIIQNHIPTAMAEVSLQAAPATVQRVTGNVNAILPQKRSGALAPTKPIEVVDLPSGLVYMYMIPMLQVPLELITSGKTSGNRSLYVVYEKHPDTLPRPRRIQFLEAGTWKQVLIIQEH